MDKKNKNILKILKNTTFLNMMESSEFFKKSKLEIEEFWDRVIILVEEGFIYRKYDHLVRAKLQTDNTPIPHDLQINNDYISCWLTNPGREQISFFNHFRTVITPILGLVIGISALIIAIGTFYLLVTSIK